MNHLTLPLFFAFAIPALTTQANAGDSDCVPVAGILSRFDRAANTSQAASTGGVKTYIGSLRCAADSPGSIACDSGDRQTLADVIVAVKRLAASVKACVGPDFDFFFPNPATAVFAKNHETQIILSAKLANKNDLSAPTYYQVRELILGPGTAERNQISDHLQGAAQDLAAAPAVSAATPAATLPASSANSLDVSAFCGGLKQVASEAHKQFVDLKGRDNGHKLWTAKVQLDKWQDCFISQTDDSNAATSYFTCETGPYKDAEENRLALDSAAMTLKKCIGDDWTTHQTIDYKNMLKFKFEGGRNDPVIELRQRTSRDKWWVSLDLDAPSQ
jgi:hypothetical protein